jgi:hypothetical protein
MTGGDQHTHHTPGVSKEPQQLQQQQQAWKAYLEPLLRKHEAQQLVTYEDLTASKAAADRLTTENKDTTSTVRRRMPCVAATATCAMGNANTVLAIHARTHVSFVCLCL